MTEPHRKSHALAQKYKVRCEVHQTPVDQAWMHIRALRTTTQRRGLFHPPPPPPLPLRNALSLIGPC